MTRKRNVYKWPEEVLKTVKLLHCHGKSYKKISNFTGVPKRTINRYISSWNAGCNNSTEYLNRRAKEYGFKKFSEYSEYRCLLRNPNLSHYQKKITNQQKKESEIELISDINNFTAPEFENFCEREELTDVVCDAINYMKTLKDGERLSQIIIMRYFEGNSLEKIGRRLEKKITRSMVSILEKKALKILGRDKRLVDFLD